MKANFSGTFLNVLRRSRFAFMRLVRFIFSAGGSLFSANLEGRGCGDAESAGPGWEWGSPPSLTARSILLLAREARDFYFARALPGRPTPFQAVKQRPRIRRRQPLPRQLFSTCRVLLTGDRGTLVS